ncbi:beta-1,4-glucuronyltransferase 1 [Sesbania bispinosa]|nr:beta-1,4-glucuronyltransferase 1 [Sesbania bispinosa]
MPLDIELNDPCNCSNVVDNVEPVMDYNKGPLDIDLNAPYNFSDVVVSLEPVKDYNKTPPIISDFDGEENRTLFNDLDYPSYCICGSFAIDLNVFLSYEEDDSGN